ncbi:tyrosine-type recombinase/integrase [Microbacterium indicum]|uniref:tyrosine-type recombinase/integrase n=1 Tax=Microbacterium indicum TaxID=358100 RepID=UPI00048F9CB6|nr:tyrosine-type recombinase/integrase [Microbacterium indicum]
MLNEFGEPIRPEWWGHQFARLVRAAGVGKIRLHGLRHSLALAMLEANVNPADAAALLSHRLEAFLGTYAPDTAERGIARAVAGLSERLADARGA